MSPGKARRPPGTAPSGVSSPGAAVSESGTLRPGGDFGVPSRTGAGKTPTCSVFEPGPRTGLHEPAACALGDPWPPGAETVSGGGGRGPGVTSPSVALPGIYRGITSANPARTRKEPREEEEERRDLSSSCRSWRSGSCPPAWNKETGTQSVGRRDAAGTERALWGMLQGDVPSTPSGTGGRWGAGAFAWGGLFKRLALQLVCSGEPGCPLFLPLLKCSLLALGDKVGSRRGLISRDCKETLPGSEGSGQRANAKHPRGVLFLAES